MGVLGQRHLYDGHRNKLFSVVGCPCLLPTMVASVLGTKKVIPFCFISFSASGLEENVSF